MAVVCRLLSKQADYQMKAVYVWDSEKGHQLIVDGEPQEDRYSFITLNQNPCVVLDDYYDRYKRLLLPIICEFLNSQISDVKKSNDIGIFY